MHKRKSKSIFVVGTDTGVGKTLVAGLLFDYLLKAGVKAITQKWIQTGKDQDIANHDLLASYGANEFARARCPYHFKLAASPHLAARQEKKLIDPNYIKKAYSFLYKKFDFMIVEGIGGALVPYNQKDLVLDIARPLKMPVLIVAQNKLGVINHLLLTIEALKKRKLKIVGVIFNGTPEDCDKKILFDNPKIVEALTRIDMLGSLPWTRNEGILKEVFRPIGNRLTKLLSLAC